MLDGPSDHALLELVERCAEEHLVAVRYTHFRRNPTPLMDDGPHLDRPPLWKDALHLDVAVASGAALTRGGPVDPTSSASCSAAAVQSRT
jgi:hypothetical protein